ncbi:hypothetical protein DSECCO2_589870 [anaerobic digester metagenome]
MRSAAGGAAIAVPIYLKNLGAGSSGCPKPESMEHHIAKLGNDIIVPARNAINVFLPTSPFCMCPISCAIMASSSSSPNISSMDVEIAIEDLPV